jgi:hypothetical protein
MKVLQANKDFFRSTNFQLNPGDKVLIKQSVATGWGKLAIVKRVMKSQVEVQVINVVPTEESNRFGTKNGLLDRSKNPENFFLRWAEKKNIWVGRKIKFFKDTGVMVGHSENWNPTILTTIFN